MKHLPSEILNIVFSNLHFNQKQECMYVCRQWANIIRSECLLERVCFHKQDLLNRFIDKLKTYSSGQTQIKHVATFNQRVLSLNVNTFCQLTPNLESIYINWILTSLPEGGDKVKDITPWQKSLEVLKEPCKNIFTRRLLSSGVWIKLTTLVVNCTLSSSIIVKYLANAPNLLDLTLISFTASVDSLEKIHDSLLSLQHFTLKDAYLFMDRELTDIIEIHPATSITSFSISFIVSRTETLIKFLHYIRRKYTSLSRLEINSTWNQIYRGPNHFMVIHHGLLPILEALGRQLAFLELGSAIIDQDVFKALHSLRLYNTKMKIATIFSEFKKLNLLEHESWKMIQELELTVSFDSTITQLKHLQELKVLKIRSKKNQTDYSQLTGPILDISYLFGLCPISLKELKIIGFRIQHETPCVNTLNITKLGIGNSNVSQSVNQYISDCLPKLRVLTINYDYFTTKGIIMLENHHLSHLSIESRTARYIQVKTQNNDEYLCYPMISQLEHVSLFRDPRHLSEYGSVRRIPAEKINNSSVLKVICASIDTLVLNRHIAF